MGSPEHETPGGAGPDQVEAPEPPATAPDDGPPASTEDLPADAPESESSTAAATDGVTESALQRTEAAPRATRTRPPRTTGRLWAAAEAKREAEAQERGESADSEVAADEAVQEAEQAVLADLARMAAERDDYLDQLRRTKADFENYRKRILRQQTEHLERAAEALAEKLLPVLDTFDAALVHGEGFEQVHAALVSTLEKEGLERIAPEGKPFDPNESDAVAHEEGDGGPVVTEVLRPGYRWKGRVLRPAMVRVRG